MQITWLILLSSILGITNRSHVLAVDLPFGTILCSTLVGRPEPIESIRPVYHLYTRSNQDTYQILNSSDHKSITGSNFNSNDETVFIIHGWRGDVRLPKYFTHSMKNAFLKKGSYNVIVVDNQKALNTINWFQAVPNNKASADVTKDLIKTLIDLNYVSLRKLHLIGHSLGAQHAGYVGHQIPGIKRITGLDPAGWCFEGRPIDERLDKSDAEFVDVIHSSGISFLVGGIGYDGECGNVDFYPNGGQAMPGCGKIEITNGLDGKLDLVRTFETTYACSHFRSCYYFEESINSVCQFVAKVCKKEFFKPKTCECGNKECNVMGLAASPLKTVGHLELDTNAHSPYCKG